MRLPVGVVRTTLAAAAFVFVGFHATAQASRHAIIIGNSAYPGDGRLPNPVNDARAMGNVLAELGFEVALLENGTLAEMKAHVTDVVEDLPDDAIVMFYYAGHAIQKNGVNWMLPIDFTVSADLDITGAAIGIDSVLREIDATTDAVKIVVLDACRNYPLGEADEVFGNGLAGVISQGETLIAYATLAGELASDGAGPNSPYTGALVSALDIDGLDLYEVFRTVRFKVRSATEGLQLPWVSGTLRREIVLRPAEEGEDPGDGIQLAGLDPVQAVHWRAIARSRDPGDFRAFTQVHGTRGIGGVALEQATRLEEGGAAVDSLIEIADEVIEGSPVTVTPCDKWVSDPLDPKRIAEGVPWGLVNTRNAIRDCSIALARDPDNPRLLFLLGRALDIAEEFDDARAFYERAAEQGYGVASRNLGYMYRNARGVPPDDARAAEYYLEAALDGIVDARKALAKLYEEGWGVPQSYPEMMRWLELSAAENYPNSLDHLGNLYRSGTYVEQDYAKAIDFYERGSDMGYGNATANLARVYRDGLGVEPDRARAMELYAEAVDNGNPFAPYHLARMLLKPEGAEQPDPARAQELLELSAERGYGWALFQLGRSWKEGDFGVVGMENAAFYFWLAAEAGRSMRNAGGEKLVESSAEQLKDIEPLLSQEARVRVEDRTTEWLTQNSLFDFSLIFPY